MTITTLAAMALLLASGASNNIPSWQADYGKAMTTAAAQQKPLAVFVGKGTAGAAGVTTDGTVPAKANELLGASFVCVYVNTDTPEGKALAGQFGLTQGVVISTKDGAKQALWYNGTLTGDALTGYLTKYSSPTLAVTATEHAGVVTASYSPAYGYPAAGGCANGQCGVRYYYPQFTGGCANGQCGR